jgi:threonine aldolase
MIRFDCDYLEGAHPLILQRLLETNLEQTPGYGDDHYSAEAREKIKAACGRPDADVHLLVGGTQTNMIVISAILRPHQGVISADSGHVNVHECGAIEATGHKVLTIPSADGKLTAAQIEAHWRAHWDDPNAEHMVQPGLVYLSQPTESGTLYTRAELEAIRAVCLRCRLPLFIDGARLGYGLTADGNDLTLRDLAQLCDVFYIGGTKVGALFGEAVVILNDAFKADFRSLAKQRGALLAKGRLLGLQFDTLFTDDLYFRIARHAVELANELRAGFAAAGYSFLFDSRTNQQFPILPDALLGRLKDKYSWDFWCRVDETHCGVRFCTSWATTAEQVHALLRDLR